MVLIIPLNTQILIFMLLLSGQDPFSLRITSTLTKEIKIGNLNHIELA